MNSRMNSISGLTSLTTSSMNYSNTLTEFLTNLCMYPLLNQGQMYLGIPFQNYQLVWSKANPVLSFSRRTWKPWIMHLKHSRKNSCPSLALFLVQNTFLLRADQVDTRQTTDDLRKHNVQRNELLSEMVDSHSYGFWIFFVLFQTFFCFTAFVYIRKEKEWNKKRR